MKRYKRPLFIFIGILCLMLGTIGIFIPLLPTTPFLLLAATLFANSSPTLHQRLLDNKYFGEYIRDFRENRAIPLRGKILALTMIWLSIGSCVVFIIDKLPLQIMLLFIAVAVSAYILHFKTKR